MSPALSEESPVDIVGQPLRSISGHLCFVWPRAHTRRAKPLSNTPPTHNQGPYDTSLSVTRHKKPFKVACHEDLTPPQAGAHHTPPPARHRLTSGSSGRARLAMIASQVGFRLGLASALAEEKGYQEAALLAELDQRK